jgi:hypothetical protein
VRSVLPVTMNGWPDTRVAAGRETAGDYGTATKKARKCAPDISKPSASGC